MDLFEASSKTEHEPLAARMRPRTLDEYVGQDHIVGKGRLLRRAIQADQLTSVIFYGPPGSGKTTLARVIARHTASAFITLNAVLTGVADIRKAIKEAEEQRNLYGKKTILFVDEVHRWNKSQQDALLPWVENGTIILIGATTENPFFEVNKALVSRSRVFQLRPLEKEDLMKAAKLALSDAERGYGHYRVDFEAGALEHIIDTANGDARSLLNALELAVETTPPVWKPYASPPIPEYGSTIYISRETAEESIQKKVVLYDRDGDYHYDIISAFIKSLRGRDPDAACYWLARMVKAGEDPHFIFRRMLISACEDTGLADPNAIAIVESSARAFDRVGLPEGRYFLAHAALYLATAPKSNSSMAFFDALAAVEKEDAEVPNHLKDSSRDAEGFGHGAGYLYPHAYRDHWVAQQYLPDSLVGRVFYTPSTQGYEAKIRDEVLSRREIHIASFNPPEAVNPISEWWLKEHFKLGEAKKEENLTYSPPDAKKNAIIDKAERAWRARLNTNRAELLTTIRDGMESLAGVLRHHRSLVWNADDALLIFDLMRKAPEGFTCGLCKTKHGLDTLFAYAKTLSQSDMPCLVPIQNVDSPFEHNALRASLEENAEASTAVFDRVFFRDVITRAKDITFFAQSVKDAYSAKENQKRDIAFSEGEALHKDSLPIFSKDALVILSQRIPSKAQRISFLIRQIGLSEKIGEDTLATMEKAEDSFFTDAANPLFSWNEHDIEKAFLQLGLNIQCHTCTLNEKRKIHAQEIDRWFSINGSSYATFLAKDLGEEKLKLIANALKEEAEHVLFDWKIENAFFCISAP